MEMETKMISNDNYWNSLSQEQKEGYWQTLSKADDEGLDLVIVDAIDIWSCIPKKIRGEKPK